MPFGKNIACCLLLVMVAFTFGCARHSLPKATSTSKTERPTAYIIFFDTGSATLNSSGVQLLQSVLDLARFDETLRFKIVGHESHDEAASQGPAGLDAARALEVMNFLRSEGFSADRAAIAGTRDRETIDNSSRNSPVDRRVEIMPY